LVLSTIKYNTEVRVGGSTDSYVALSLRAFVAG